MLGLTVTGILNASTLQQGGSSTNVLYAPSNHVHTFSQISGNVSTTQLPAASINGSGIVKLNDTTGSFSQTEAATANILRQVSDAATSARSIADQAKNAADSASSSAANAAQMFSGSWTNVYNSDPKYGMQFYTSAQGLYWGGVSYNWYGGTRFLITLPTTGLYTVNAIATWYSGGATRRVYCSQFVKLEYINSVQIIRWNSNKLGESLSLGSDAGGSVSAPFGNANNLWYYANEIPVNTYITWNISVFKECVN